MSLFVAFVGAYCLAGFLVWYFIPALRPTRLAYTAVCMGVECVKYVWPFVSAVIKEAAKEIAAISALEGPTLQQVMDREGRSTLYPSSYLTDIPLSTSRLPAVPSKVQTVHGLPRRQRT